MTNKQQKGQSADETAQGACSMNTSPTMPKNAKRKPGRPKSTNREDDEALYKQLRSNPEGKGIERKAWQNSKWDEFEAGKFFSIIFNRTKQYLSLLYEF